MAELQTIRLISELPVRKATIYPDVYAKEVSGRTGIALGDPFGISQYGVNVVVLEPGAWSSHRHTHAEEDELLMALDGDMVLVDNFGRHPFRPGMVAGFKAGGGNAHQVINESNKEARFLVIGTRSQTESVVYPDVDMMAIKTNGKFVVTRKDGTPF
jgi:uncharacterized cupin superfamily protein